MTGFAITGRLYDTLKWMVIVVLPGLGTLYFTLAEVWNFGYADQVVKTDVAICAFLGLVLGISHVNYRHSEERFDGTAYVNPAAPEVNPDVQLKNPDESKGEVLLKVEEVVPPSGGLKPETDDPLP